MFAAAPPDSDTVKFGPPDLYKSEPNWTPESTSSTASVGLGRNGQEWAGMDRAYVKMQKKLF